MVLFGKICRVQLLSFSLTKISVFGHYDTILGRGVGGKIELNPVVGNSDRDWRGGKEEFLGKKSRAEIPLIVFFGNVCFHSFSSQSIKSFKTFFFVFGCHYPIGLILMGVLCLSIRSLWFVIWVINYQLNPKFPSFWSCNQI